MRILAIRGQNLASLAREFAVELASGELAEIGLFAITGPVGAGKSTLLDALCLALFDRTPRLRGRGGALIGDQGQDESDWLRASDPRTLLRRNAVDGFAEADFVGRDGVAYRSRWSVRRARRRADGRLQDQEIVLTRVRDGLVVAGGRRTEVTRAIQQRLGLDFDQFCRSVVLAQGEFHAFLHAPAQERARLLETLTGAQLYRRLSQAAFERRREHDQVVQRLRSNCEQLVVLEPDARERLAAERDRLARELELCEVAMKLATGYVSWHEAAEEHRREEQEAAAALQQAVLADREAVARRERLEVRQRALAAWPRLEVADELRVRVRDAEAAVRDAETRLQADERRLEAADRELRAALRDVRGGGIGDEIPAIVSQWTQWRPVLRRWSAQRRQLDELRRELGRLGRVREQAAEAVRRSTEEGRALERALAAARGRVGAAQRVVDEADDGQLGDRRRALAESQLATQQRATLLDACRAAVAACDEARRELAGIDAQQAPLEQRLRAAGARVTACEQELEAAARELRRVSQHPGLAALREQLVAGEACPVCGSLEHPDAGHGHDREADAARAASRLQAAEVAEREARGDVATARAELQGRERDAARAGRSLAAAEDRERAAREQLARALGEPVHDLDAVVEHVRVRRAREREQDEQLVALERAARQRGDALRSERERAESAERARDEWRTRHDRLAAIERAAADAAVGAEQQLARGEAVTAELDERLAPACDGFARGLQSLAELAGDPEQVLERPSALEAARRSAEEAVGDRRRELHEARARAGAASDERARAEVALADALRAAEVDEQDVQLAGRLGADGLREEREFLQGLRDEVARRRTELGVRQQLRRRHEQHGSRPTLDLRDARQAREDARRRHEQVREQHLQLHGKLDFDERMQKQRAELQPRLERAERELDTWRALDDLIGSSSGDRFAVFAQGLTLDLLLLEANRRLEELARRYRLEKTAGEQGQGGELDFVVVDLDMGGTRRSLHTLSGGETFLVSLSLALALATLAAPSSRVETLFLDEGFGTLDAHNLEIALGALDSLQATGCQVGIISHVDGIAERIGAVVEVRPEGSGQSRVLIRGV